ncbi:MAG: hypothetical protein JWR21_3076 [Herminiimonas sp.]|nr:hypothetical protein [Herminiimonas sp.]MDB5855720.1 hypothetical protein [Herminiimonas sp.]
MDLYVYYQVPIEQADQLLAAVRAMHRSVAAEQGVVGALKRRPEEQNGRHTWMEIYPAIPDGFDKALERAVERAGLANLIVGPRHNEYFMDAGPCA